MSLDQEWHLALAEAVQAARVRDPARHITLTGLSGALTPLELQGEEAGMHQVLGNLLTWDEMRRKLELVATAARTIWG